VSLALLYQYDLLNGFWHKGTARTIPSEEHLANGSIGEQLDVKQDNESE